MARPRLFKLSRRAMSTSWSIALCTMFIVASFTLASSLRDSASMLKNNFPEDYFLITHPIEGGLAPIDASALQEVSAKTAFGLFSFATLEPGGDTVGVFSVRDTNLTLPMIVQTMSGNSVLTGLDLVIPSGQTSISLSGVPATVSGHFYNPMFSFDWILSSEEMVRQLTGIQTGFTFAISKGLTPSEAEGISSHGYQVHLMSGIIEFLGYSVGEAGSDSYWILFPSSVAIAILAYGFAGSMASDRRHDIGIMKTIGAGRRSVLSVLMSNALLVSVLGGLLGLALGIIASYGIATIASSLFSAVLVVRMSEWVLLLSLAATIASASVGAVIPAIRMTSSMPVSDLREVPP